MDIRGLTRVLVFGVASLVSMAARAEELVLPALRCEATVLSTLCDSGKIRVDLVEGKFLADLNDSYCWQDVARATGVIHDEGRGGYPFFGRRLQLGTLGTLELRVPFVDGGYDDTESRPALLRVEPSAQRNGPILARTQYDLMCRKLETQ
ncbi:MAG: hypothetical protein RJB38_2373 [Pseudomonadota bacterium]|jgi:hypothetical protein